jgi:hypothetical protein
MATYTNRNEAINREIVEAIEAGDASAENYNIDVIADAVLGDYEDGFSVKVDEAEFWNIVAENEI